MNVHRPVTLLVTLALLLSSVAGLVVAVPTSAAAATVTVGADDCAQVVDDATGVTVAKVGTDCVITFSEGTTTWTVPSGLTSVSVLLVAGGGGGGGGGVSSGNTVETGGGGGAGGVIQFSSLSLVPGSEVTLLVGGGGAGGASGSSGSAGSPTSMKVGSTTYVAKGGGFGGAPNIAGGAGGSGGGAGSGGGTPAGGAGDAEQGSDGGLSPSPNGGAGGGGGRDGKGGNGVQGNRTSGAGGSGITRTISGSSVEYARGGAGGSSSAMQGPDATTLGGGGTGGANSGGVGGAGGSGVVVVRFATGSTPPPDDPGGSDGSGDPVDPPQPLAACAATSHNGLQVAPSHGPILYVDTGQSQNIDAGYLAYRVTSDTARSDLWVQLEDLEGGVVSLVDPRQSAVPLGQVGAGETRAAFFLMKATGGTTVPQSHVVRVYRSDPRVGSPDPLYQCDFTLARVDETIKAAANKVDSIAVSSAVQIGDTYTITVEGDSGTIGAGNRDDGRMIWVSPAARSDWPTRALRLEKTEVTLYADSARTTQLSTHRDVLRINASTGLTTKNRQYYTAVYTFRVIGAAATAVPIIPTAMISSGTQIKHTDVGSLPTGDGGIELVVDITEPDVLLKVDKSADSTLELNQAAETARVTYRIELDNTAPGSPNTIVDAIVDTPDAKLTFVPGSAKYNGVPVLNPTKSGADLVFSGPLEVPAGAKRVLEYQMQFPFDACEGGDPSFVNTAFAQVGDVIIGSSATAKPKVTVSIGCDGESPKEEAAVDDKKDESVPPTVVTVPASGITDTTVQLNALVDPNGSAGNVVRFVYSKSADLSSSTVVGLDPTTNATSAYGVTTSLTLLEPSKTYYFRIEVGATTGSDPASYILGDTLSFRTQDPPATPTVVTGTASGITSSSAVLEGTVNPERVATQVLFEWAEATGGSTADACSPGTNVTSVVLTDEDDEDSEVVLDSAAPVLMTFTATGLDANTFYCFRIVALHGVNFATRVEGAWKSFETLSVQTITVIDPTDPTDPVQPLASPVALVVGEGQAIKGSSTASLTNFTYISEDPEVCTVTGDGSGGVLVRAISPGSCTVRVEESGTATIEPAFATISFTVSAKQLQISAPTSLPKVYDGTTAAEVELGALEGVVNGDVVTVTAVATYDNENVGTGKTVTVVYTLGGADAGNYLVPAHDPIKDGVITPATVTVTPNTGQSKVFGEADPTFTFTATGLLGSDILTGSLGREAGGDVGAYAFTLGDLSAGDNYSLELAEGSPTFAITQATLTVTPTEGQSKVFGGADPTFTFTLDPDVAVTGSLERAPGEAVGTYAFTLGDLSAGPNYALELAASPATFAITQKDAEQLTVGPLADEVFTGSPITPTPVVLDGDTVLTLTTDYTLAYVDNTDVGTATVTITGVGSYTGTATATFEITRADSSVTVKGDTTSAFTFSGGAQGPDADDFVATGSDGAVTVSYSGKLEDGTPYGPSPVAPTDAGAYQVVATVAQDANHSSATSAPFTFVIAPATVTVTPDTGQSKVFGEADPTFTFQATGLPVSGSLTGSLARVDGKNVGSYAYTLGDLSGGNNYTVVMASSPPTFEITARELVVTAEAVSKVFGAADPDLTFTVTGLQGDDQVTDGLTGSLSRDGDEDVGSYVIRVGTLAATANYSLSFIEGTFTITAKSLSGFSVVPIDPLVYTGSELTPAVVVKDGSTDLDKDTDFTVVYASNTDVGTATVTITGTDTGNYTGTQTVKFEITPKALTISGTTLTRTKAYDGDRTAAVTAVGSLDGVVSNDDVTVTATATYDDANVGTGKTITVDYTLDGADAGNYTAPADFVVTDGVITGSQLTIADPTLTRSKVYDGTDSAAVTAGTLSGVVGGDEVTVTATATYSDANVGTGKTITVIYTLGGADAGKYQAPANFVITDGEITKAALTISGTKVADEKVYDGTDSAAVTAVGSLAGVVSGDEVTVTVTAIATYVDANVGTGKTITVVYTLEGAAAENYAAPENLEVTGAITARELVVTAAAVSKVFGADDPGLTFTVTGLQDGDEVTDVLTGSLSRVGGVDVGSYVIGVGSLAATANYSLSFIEGTFTITAKSLSGFSVVPIDPLVYTGSALTPDVVVKDGSTDLDKDTDFTVVYASNTDVGTATVTVTGIGNYMGVVPVEFEITPKVLTLSDVEEIGQQIFTGSELTPAVVVKDGSIDLVEDTDFTVMYSNNKDVGTATVTITGTDTGNYTGTITVQFTIVKKLTVAAQTRLKLVGQPDPDLTFNDPRPPDFVGAFTLDTPITVSRTPGEEVGAYAITTAGGSVGGFMFDHQAGSVLQIARLDVPGVLGTTTPVAISRGDSITCECEGLLPGMQVTVTMFSSPVILGTDTVNADGECPLLTALSIPDELDEGEHTLEVKLEEGAGNDGVLGGAPIIQTATVDLTTPVVDDPPSLPPGPSDDGTADPEDAPPSGPTEGSPGPLLLPPLPPGPEGLTAAPLLPRSPEDDRVDPAGPRVPASNGTGGGRTDGPSNGSWSSLLGGGTGGTIDLGPRGGTTSLPIDASLGEIVAASRATATVGLDVLAQESFRGFAPGSGIRIEVIGARSTARFVVTEVGVIDAFVAARAIKRSAVYQAADFARITAVRPLDAAPVGRAPTWSAAQRQDAEDQFTASRLPQPSMLTDLDLSTFTQWVEVSGEVSSYLPGSMLHLTVTSEPVVLSSVVVGRDGTAVISAVVPIELLGIGEHRVRFVGTRVFGGLSVDAAGEIQLSDEVLAQIDRFDRGTDATVIVYGLNGAGGSHVSLRIVPLDPTPPWWTLWIVVAAWLGAIGLRRRGRLEGMWRRIVAHSVVVAAGVPAVILGWFATTTVVTLWGAGLAALASLLLGAIVPKAEDEDAAGGAAEPLLSGGR